MKTQILILLVSLFSLVANASNTPNTITGIGKSIVVKTAGWKSEKVKIQISDLNGVIVMDEEVKSLNNSRVYNLKNLPNGNYIVQISNELRQSTQDFVIKDNNVIVSPEINTTFKPVLIWNDNTLDLNLMNLGGKASLSLLDEDNNVVFNNSLEGVAIHKRYDTKKLSSNKAYTVVVNVNNKSYAKVFVKK